MPKYSSKSSYKGKIKRDKLSMLSPIRYIKKDSEHIVYHNTDMQWLVKFLEDGKISPLKGKKFISFSLPSASTWGGQFGSVEVVIDYGKLWKQGIHEINYDTIWNETEDEEIIKHVTGFRSKKDYYEDEKGYSLSQLSWKEYVRTFEEEEEIITKGLAYEDGLIKKVILPKMSKKTLLDKKLKSLLDKYQIPYEERKY